MKYGFIREQQQTYPVTVLCGVMKVSTSAFYARSRQPESTDKTREQEKLKSKISALFEENKKVYGARRLSGALETAGMKAGRYKVGRLMTELGLEVRYPKKFKITTNSNHNKMISPNILNYPVDVTEANTIWTADITYVWTAQSRHDLISQASIATITLLVYVIAAPGSGRKS